MVTARVTVLMTTYNGAALIGESIASILAQTFRDFELLVIDDASTDNTRTVVATIGDPRVRLLARPAGPVHPRAGSAPDPGPRARNPVQLAGT